MQRNAVKKWQNSLDRHRGKKMMSNLRMPVGVSDFREFGKMATIIQIKQN